MVTDVTGLLLMEKLLDGLPVEHLAKFEQRIAVDVLGYHDLGLLVEEAAHEKTPLNSVR